MTQLELLTDQGLIGRSFPEMASWSVDGTSLIEPHILPRILGENPFFVERIWEKMYIGNRKPVAKGEYIAAMGAVDCAVWDIIGKALNLPVYKVLGAYTDRVRVYAAGGYYEDGKDASGLAKEMEGYVRDGFRAVKIKVGGAPMAEDVERIRAVRKALGPDIDIDILVVDRAASRRNPHEPRCLGAPVGDVLLAVSAKDHHQDLRVELRLASRRSRS